MHCQFALKLIPAGRHQEYYRRLRLEAETIARLQHPGVVEIYDIGEYQHGLYLVLELLQPGGLGTLQTEEKHNPHWAAALVHQLAETVAYAHQEDVIHRDLKPENILLASSKDTLPDWDALQPLTISVPRVKITDFGLAKCLDTDSNLTQTGLVMGTPDYMAPEQLPDSHEEIGAGTDIYALGGVLYELLTGRLPFVADNITQLLCLLRDDEPLPPRQINPKIPADLETICLTCLRKNPSLRYSSAQALADDLACFLQNEPIQARPLRWWEHVYLWSRRNPIAAIYYAAFMVFYCLHLFNMLVLEVPKHQGFFHLYVTFTFALSIVIITVIQDWLNDPRRRRLGEWSYLLFAAVLPTVLMSADAGPSSVPVDIYFFIIVFSIFIRPHPHIVWVQTILSVLSYLALTAITWYFQPQYLVPIDHMLFALIGLFFMGGVMHLILRRSQQFMGLVALSQRD